MQCEGFDPIFVQQQKSVKYILRNMNLILHYIKKLLLILLEMMIIFKCP